MTPAPLSFKLPKITPRGNEVKAVEAILESDEYESAAKMARAIVVAVHQEMFARDWFIVGFNNDGSNLLYGPFATDSAAYKAMPSLGVGGLAAVFKVRSLSGRAEQLAGIDGETVAANCAWCGHPQPTHEFPRKHGCVVRGCTCKNFRKEER